MIEQNNTGLNLSCSLSSFPATFIHGAIQDDSPRAISGSCVPAKGLSSSVALQQRLSTDELAKEHFAFYKHKLDPFVHYVLADGESLRLLSKRSEFLAVATCTVAAYCAGTPDYDEWLELYKSLASARTFAKQHAFDDVRALCIGALWLTEMATALNALGMPNTRLSVNPRLTFTLLSDCPPS